MNDQRKKIAAVTAAVFSYIQAEEEAACLAACACGSGVTGVSPEQKLPGAVSPNVWGMAGRSDLMQGRTMMQLRVFR